jgi:hypothetical protein
MWHDNIVWGDHECVEEVMESDCAFADSNAFIAESNVHCDTDTCLSDSYMRIAALLIVILVVVVVVVVVVLCALLIVTCCAGMKCAL